MKKIVLLITAVVYTVSGFSQKSADIGIWGGTSSYFGDIKEASPIQTFNLNVGAFFRYNFNARVALRATFLTGSFSSEGIVEYAEFFSVTNEKDDELFNFQKNAQDISAMVEINYLKYILGDRKTLLTPYIMGGLGMMYFPYTYLSEEIGVDGQKEVKENEESVSALTIPFGFGFKFSVGTRMEIGVEYQMRKLFSDKFDDLDDPLSFQKESEENGENNKEFIKYTDLLHNNDWPGYLGIHITYKLYSDQKACPAYDRKYW